MLFFRNKVISVHNQKCNSCLEIDESDCLLIFMVNEILQPGEQAYVHLCHDGLLSLVQYVKVGSEPVLWQPWHEGNDYKDRTVASKFSIAGLDNLKFVTNSTDL